MSYYRQQLEDWLKTLDVKADTVLDIGGAQGPVKGRTKSWNVKEYKILDLPDFNIEALDGEVWLALPKADTIFCLEVFEYLIVPTIAIHNIETCLRKGGTAYISFAFSYPHHNELEWDSLRYTETAIKRLSEFAELKINHVWYRTDKSGLLRQFYAADGMHPAKEYDHHDVTGFIVEFVKE